MRAHRDYGRACLRKPSSSGPPPAAGTRSPKPLGRSWANGGLHVRRQGCQDDLRTTAPTQSLSRATFRRRDPVGSRQTSPSAMTTTGAFWPVLNSPAPSVVSRADDAALASTGDGRTHVADPVDEQCTTTDMVASWPIIILASGNRANLWSSPRKGWGSRVEGRPCSPGARPADRTCHSRHPPRVRFAPVDRRRPTSRTTGRSASTKGALAASSQPRAARAGP